MHRFLRRLARDARVIHIVGAQVRTYRVVGRDTAHIVAEYIYQQPWEDHALFFLNLARLRPNSLRRIAGRYEFLWGQARSNSRFIPMISMPHQVLIANEDGRIMA
jgi:hypothetical protein